MDRWADGQRGRWTDGRTAGWVGGPVGGQTARGAGGRVNRRTTSPGPAPCAECQMSFFQAGAAGLLAAGSVPISQRCTLNTASPAETHAARRGADRWRSLQRHWPRAQESPAQRSQRLCGASASVGGENRPLSLRRPPQFLVSASCPSELCPGASPGSPIWGPSPVMHLEGQRAAELEGQGSAPPSLEG